ncbi:hypothetical protein SNEBB_003410 [Seison nebaliae]|nr:hypothetical protein SNEBB_003410 [Seison nebaliae]
MLFIRLSTLILLSSLYLLGECFTGCPKHFPVNFALFNQQHPIDPLIISSANIANSSFDYSTPTVFIVHGYLNHENMDWMIDMKDALLQNNPTVNVINIGWGKGAETPIYPLAACRTKFVGREIGDLILKTKINPKLIHCIGHSLGAHICGFMGKAVEGIKRISGIDPAGPYFESQSKENRLSDTDANFVDIIHADKYLGIHQAIGNVDFFPNGGKMQPGCWTRRRNINLGPNCSHVRAIQYYISSIRQDCSFVATNCISWDEFKGKDCEGNKKMRMGYFASSLERTQHFHDTYFLNVERKYPFCC